MLFDFLLFLFLIVCASCAFVLVLTWMKRRENHPADSQEQAALRRELAQLRERVQTLEKIVTDSSYDLSREIETL